ncbi:MAG: hypothetical protein ACRDNS_12535, partial [Trebonia sp.]
LTAGRTLKNRVGEASWAALFVASNVVPIAVGWRRDELMWPVIVTVGVTMLAFAVLMIAALVGRSIGAPGWPWTRPEILFRAATIFATCAVASDVWAGFAGDPLTVTWSTSTCLASVPLSLLALMAAARS